MPPVRTMPPAKAIKTERTHEENQERAYIAASRRSDRSLEARVESARRASDIHKRRTGRSLRVTEQDVINEEMYEEEDDDLPGHYRRLTAHLQTPNADFNKRLSAYLTSNVAMRSAVEQAVHNSYNQQFGIIGQHFGQSMYPSPILAHQASQQQAPQQPMRPQPQSPSSYRHAPYTSASSSRMQQMQQSGHQRSASFAVPQDSTRSHPVSPMAQSNIDRRMSLPIQTKVESPIEDEAPRSATSSRTFPRPSFPPGSFSQQQVPQYSMAALNANLPSVAPGQNLSPSNLTFPPQVNMSFGNPTYGMNDPWMNNMMAGSEFYMGNAWGSDGLANVSDLGKQAQNYPSVAGLNSTLAPADTNAQNLFQDQAQSSTFFDDAVHANSDGSTSNTPGLNHDLWGEYINTEHFEAPSSQQSQVQ